MTIQDDLPLIGGGMAVNLLLNFPNYTPWYSSLLFPASFFTGAYRGFTDETFNNQPMGEKLKGTLEDVVIGSGAGFSIGALGGMAIGAAAALYLCMPLAAIGFTALTYGSIGAIAGLEIGFKASALYSVGKYVASGIRHMFESVFTNHRSIGYAPSPA